MQIVDILMQVLARFAAAIPNVVGALIVAFGGWLFSRLASKALGKILEKTGTNKLARRLNESDFIQRAKIVVIPSKIIAKLVYYVLLLIFLMAATDILGMPIVSQMVADLIAYIPNFVAAVLLFIIGIVLSEGVKKLVLAACQSLGIPSASIIANFAFYLVFLTLTISALSQARIETELITANLTVILGGIVVAFAIGYGLASRDAMANFLASFYSRSKVQIGDVITVDGSRGKVIAMDTSSLTLESEDGHLIVIPLRKLTTEKIEIHQRSEQKE